MGATRVGLIRFFRTLIRAQEPPFDDPAEMITAACKRARDRVGGASNIDHFHDAYGVRHIYKEALAVAKKVSEQDPPEANHINSLSWRLAELVIQLPVEIDDFLQLVPEPFSASPGKKALIVVGERIWDLPRQHTHAVRPYDRHAVDIMDVKASQLVGDTLKQFGWRIELVWAPSDMRHEVAGQKLDEMLGKKQVGCIVSIGSRVANPLTVPLTKHMLDKVNLGREDLPAQLQFCVPVDTDVAADDLVSRPEQLTCNDIGVQLQLHRPAVGGHRKLKPEEDVELLKREDHTGRDAGILMIHYDRTTPRLLCACVGHGGRSTLALASALAKHPHETAERIEVAATDFLFRRPENAARTDFVFAPVEVNGTSWQFRWPLPFDHGQGRKHPLPDLPPIKTSPVQEDHPDRRPEAMA